MDRFKDFGGFCFYIKLTQWFALENVWTRRIDLSPRPGDKQQEKVKKRFYFQNLPGLPPLGSGLSASTSSPSGSQGSWSLFSDGLAAVNHARNLSPGFRNIDRVSTSSDRFRNRFVDVRPRGPVCTSVSVLQPDGWPPRLRAGSGFNLSNNVTLGNNHKLK